MPRQEVQSDNTLPIHFFTIVLNGEPFIRYHEAVLRRLAIPWHWHIIEGVAELKRDTAWSVAAGGHIPDSVHDLGRSNDGTSDYLDDLARRCPANVTLYRKPPGKFWAGKREMVDAPLVNIRRDCLLWQIDSDELWTAEQIETVHGMFARDPTRTAAYYWCWYFVGPDRIISTRHNYAENPAQEWLRTWYYRPGVSWAAHEPPTLVVGKAKGYRPKSTDIAQINPFTHDEMEAAGVVFQHFAYATESQVAFKEHYYGYKEAVEQWHSLLSHRGSGALKDYFGWVSDNTMFDDAVHNRVEPLARLEQDTGRWRFDGAATTPKAAVKRPRIVVDGVFWQYLSSGVGRVWENLLREWVASGFIDNVVLLDRAGTAPRLAGVHYRTIARHDYARTGQDSRYLDDICRWLDADLFVSTYYSSPTTTPSFFSGYDMIPEVLGFPLDDEAWQEKRRAILHAAAHAMISTNSARDLERLYPSVAAGGTYVALCGVDPTFHLPPPGVTEAFKARHGLDRRPYALMVGERLGFGGYKNGALAFRALAALPEDRKLTLVCVGGQPEIEPRLRDLAPGLDARRLVLNDDELAAAYAGAHALLYPSKYEGFGMPPLECMACGTPAIVCHNSSLPEVVGDAAVFVDPDDPAMMVDAIERLFDPATRADLIARGLRQAARFSFAAMAERMASALVVTDDRLRAGLLRPPDPAWTELRDYQMGRQNQGISVSPNGGAVKPGAGVRSPGSFELERALRTIDDMRKSPFWKARELTIRAMRKIGLR